jgi:hypothetical protein
MHARVSIYNLVRSNSPDSSDGPNKPPDDVSLTSFFVLSTADGSFNGFFKPGCSRFKTCHVGSHLASPLSRASACLAILPRSSTTCLRVLLPFHGILVASSSLSCWFSFSLNSQILRSQLSLVSVAKTSDFEYSRAKIFGFLRPVKWFVHFDCHELDGLPSEQLSCLCAVIEIFNGLIFQ